jgi:hypothetical protein
MIFGRLLYCDWDGSRGSQEVVERGKKKHLKLAANWVAFPVSVLPFSNDARLKRGAKVVAAPAFSSALLASVYRKRFR